jgi:hypothetical protein
VGRIHRVKVATACDTVEVSWEARQQLLERVRGHEGANDVIARFETVGTTRPVTGLGATGKRLLLAATTEWVDEAGVGGLPAGVWDLRCALIDDRDGGFWDE